MEIQINVWRLLDKKIQEEYPDSVVLMYDRDGYAGDDESEFHPTLEAKFHVFDSIEDLVIGLEELRYNVVSNFTRVWINGSIDDEFMYEYRG